MRGHVFIANEQSLRVAHKENTFAVFAEDRAKQQWRKTRADILADLSCLRQGDQIFFYNTDDTSFWGIYEVTARLFYDDRDIGFSQPAPYRIGVRPFIQLQNPVTEASLFSRRNAARDFRSIFFKKVLNRGKACTHLFPEETTALTKVLLMHNDYIPDACNLPMPASSPTPMIPQFESPNGECSLEKELEWWLMYHLDSNEECRKIFGDGADFEMFANYIPITISGGNMDLVVYHQRQVNNIRIRNKISIVELKKGLADHKAIKEVESYVRWLIQNIVGAENASIIQPIIIASAFAKTWADARRYWNLCERKPRLLKYRTTSNKTITFDEVEYEK